jgi:RHS repeat-associated protein
MNQLVRRGLNSMQQAQAEEEARYPIEVRHIVCDHLGTPLALIDAGGPLQGQITWAARYGAWGDIEAEYNPYQIEQPIRFQGQQFDPETGLHYNRFRYYDSTVGGYISQDPIGLMGGTNNFLYPFNPVGSMDPLGLDGSTVRADQAAGIPSGSAWGLLVKKPRSDGQPLGYGCGDASTDNLVPDKPLGNDFLLACRAHDQCYGNTSGPSKEVCDTNFKKYEKAVKTQGGPAFNKARGIK